jgi:hypothetical protein
MPVLMLKDRSGPPESVRTISGTELADQYSLDCHGADANSMFSFSSIFPIGTGSASIICARFMASLSCIKTVSKPYRLES